MYYQIKDVILVKYFIFFKTYIITDYLIKINIYKQMFMNLLCITYRELGEVVAH